MKKTLFWTLIAAAFLFCMSCDTGSSPSGDQTTTATKGGTGDGTSPGGSTTGSDDATPIATTYDCIRISGTSETKYGSTGVAIQFSLSAATDFTGGDYSATFDAYVPSSSATISAIQIQLPNSSWDASVFQTSTAIATNAWVPVSIPLSAANLSYGELKSDSAYFRIYGLTDAAGKALEFYVKNVRISNGATTALSIDVTATSDFSGNYAPIGTDVAFSTERK